GLVTLSATATAVDSDNDTATTTVSVDLGGNVSFDDDVPTITTSNLAIANLAGIYSGVLDFDVGADAQSFLDSFGDGSLVWNNQPDGDGFELVYDGNNTFIAQTTGDNSEEFFKLTILSDGTYDFELVNPKPVTETQVPQLLQGITGGSGLESYTFDSGLFGGLFSLVLTGLIDDAPSTLTISSTQLGVADNVVHGGDVLKFDVEKTTAGDDSNASISNLTLTLGATAGLKSEDVVTFNVFYEGAPSETINVIVGPQLGTGDNKYHEVTINLDPAKEVDYLSIQSSDDSVQFKISGVALGYSTQEFPDDYELEFSLTGTDSDNDGASTDFSVLVKTEDDGAYTITGTPGNDVIYGTPGNDVLEGISGADTFVWNLNDEGTSTDPAEDTVTDFTSAEGDVLNIADLLEGEDAGNIDSYIVAKEGAGNLLLYIKHDGGADGAVAIDSDGTNADQVITLVDKGFDSWIDPATEAPFDNGEDLIQHLIATGQINIDQ
ncbi:type I secretion C-terminal target domain-containing protein, partial [Halomonas aquatica]